MGHVMPECMSLPVLLSLRSTARNTPAEAPHDLTLLGRPGMLNDHKTYPQAAPEERVHHVPFDMNYHAKQRGSALLDSLLPVAQSCLDLTGLLVHTSPDGPQVGCCACFRCAVLLFLHKAKKQACRVHGQLNPRARLEADGRCQDACVTPQPLSSSFGSIRQHPLTQSVVAVQQRRPYSRGCCAPTASTAWTARTWRSLRRASRGWAASWQRSASRTARPSTPAPRWRATSWSCTRAPATP